MFGWWAFGVLTGWSFGMSGLEAFLLPLPVPKKPKKNGRRSEGSRGRVPCDLCWWVDWIYLYLSDHPCIVGCPSRGGWAGAGVAWKEGAGQEHAYPYSWLP